MLPLLSLALSNVLAALVLAVLALLVGRFLRRPAVTHALWLLVLIKLITPPLVRVEVPWPAAAPAAPAAEAEPVAEPVEVAGPALEPGDDVLRIDAVAEVPPVIAPPADVLWPNWLVGPWLTGTALWFVLAGWRAWAFNRLLRFGKPASDSVRRQVAEVAERLGVACPPVLVVPGRIAPLVWGVFRPVLVLPDGLKRTVGEDGWRTIVAHELAHVRRGDPLVRGLELLVNGLYWWCPLAWLACRELREAEEQCCDAWVVRTLPEQKKAYALALVDVLDFLSEAPPPAPLCSGLGPVADLKRRLTMILDGVTSPRLGRGAGVTMLLTAAFVLPLVPGWSAAQGERPREEPRKDDPRFRPDPGARGIEEEIARKARELEELKHRLAESKKPRADVARLEGGPTITIAISGIGGKPEEVEALVKKIREAVGGDKRVIVVAQDKKVIVGKSADGKEMRLEWKFSEGGKGIAVAPAPAVRAPAAVPALPPMPPVPPAPGVPGMPPPALARTPFAGHGGGPVDAKRIADLERRLEELMRRMEDMAEKMRRPGGGGGGVGPMGPGRPGAGPGPGIGGGRGAGAAGGGEGGEGGRR